MPVDEDNIDTLLADADAKLRISEQKRQQIKAYIRALASIRMVDDRSTPPVKVKPQDRSLGAEMSNARRQDIYDKSVADAAGL